MLLKLLPILLTLGSCLCEWEDCSDTKNSVVKIEITDCNQGEECRLRKNSDVAIKITFTNVEATALQSKVCGIIPGLGDNCIGFPLYGTQSDACQSGVKCPVKEGDTNTYTASLSILSIFPLTKATVIWKLVNEKGKVVLCMKIPAKIVGSKKPTA